jgi:homoserine O-succinyltransferase
MAVILPSGYTLEGGHVALLSAEQAQRADIRPLRIGIINVMPQAERYEYHLLYPLGKSIIQVEPIWIRLGSHGYKSSDKTHLDRFYTSFEQANAPQTLDGLILTGAPIEQLPYEEVTYWDELSAILRFSRTHIHSTMGICWGGLALAKILGIEKRSYSMKIFGVYDARNLDRSHPITGDFDDAFACPQSRHSGIDDAVLEDASRAGMVRLLAHAPGAGYVIFESSDRRFLMHLGHPEYEAGRLATEYWRDQKRGRTDVPAPTNVDLENPLNRWRTNCLDFFTQWLRFLYEASTTG